MKISLQSIKTTVICCLAICIFVSAVNNFDGKANHTGSPGEMTCVQCHASAPLNSGDGSIKISSQIPIVGYVPGETYSVTVTVAQDNVTVFGFDFQALTADNKNAGILQVTSPETKILTEAGKINVVHSNSDPFELVGVKVFTFNWTAPANLETVTFYASANAANGDGSPRGDFIYTTSTVVNPQLSTSTAKQTAGSVAFSIYPTLSSGQITLAADNATGGEVTLQLYNTKGDMLQELYSNITPSGSFHKTFDLSAYPSGVYFIKMRTNGNISAKMIVLQ